MTARIASIQRHPLKSHGREALDEVVLSAGHGLPWDRAWAVAHEAARLTPGEWAACANFSRGAKAPKLMAISARLDVAKAELTLSHPELAPLTFRPDDPADQARFLEWVRPIVPADRAKPAAIFAARGVAMTDSDYQSVSLINLASNRALGMSMGLDLSPLRWRGNFWIEGLEPFAEADLPGRRIRLGAALLEVVEPIERCLATTANPETGVRDADTLAGLRDLVANQNFGVYARVIEGGTVRTGDVLQVSQ